MKKLRNLIDVVRTRAAISPAKEVFLFLANGEEEADRLTYGQLDHQARALAAALQDRGLEGERALLLFPPGLDFIVAFLGCLYAGVVAVPAYPPRRRGDERLRSIIAGCAPRLVLSDATIRRRVERQGDDALTEMTWLTELGNGHAELWREDAITSSSLAFLQYTSGSTAAPKGVRISHGNLLHNEAALAEVFATSTSSRIVSWLPQYHDMGLIGGVLQPIYAGASAVLFSPVAFLQRPLRWLQAVARYRATISGAPNFAYELCAGRIRDEELAELDLSSWRVAFNGAEPVRAETLERFADRFSPRGFERRAFFPCYGLAEATLLVSGGEPGRGPRLESLAVAELEERRALPAAGGRRLLGCGRRLADQQLLIVAPEQCRRCAEGEVGEIWLAGPSIADGYWQDARATEETFAVRLADDPEAGPFLRTGDLGFFLGDELFVCGRLKDLIILRGRNLHPQDLEATAVDAHADVRLAGAAAFSVDGDGEECLVLVVEVEPRAGKHDELAEAVRGAVSVEHEVAVHDLVLVRAGTLPKTSSGKVRRSACRERYLKGELAVEASFPLLAPQSGPGSSAGRRWHAAEFLALPPGELHEVVETVLCEELARLAGLDAERVDVDRSLNVHGVDSLLAIELQQALERRLSLAVPLADLLAGLTPRQLAARVVAAPAMVSDVGEEEVDEPAELPLSHGQRALWFLSRLAPESAAYHIAAAARLRSPLDVAALRAAAAMLIERHAMLHTVFVEVDGEPVQRMLDDLPIPVEHVAASDTSPELETWLRQRASEPFQLAEGPLFRLVLREEESSQVILLVLHHAIGDLWSVAILVRELAALYAEARGGPAAELPAVRMSYGDHVRRQAELLAGSRGDELLDFWRRALAGAPLELALPTDRAARRQSFAGSTERQRLGPALAQRVREAARDRGTTPYTVLLAAFQALLYRSTGQQDLLVGTPTAGRPSGSEQADFSQVVGYFVNPLVLRARVDGKVSLAEHLDAVKATVLDAFEHRDLPFAVLAQALCPARQLGRSPVFQVMLAWQRAPRLDDPPLQAWTVGESGVPFAVGPLVGESLVWEQGVAQFELTLVAAELDDDLGLLAEYRTDLFDATTVRRLLRHYATLLAGVLAAPERAIDRLPWLTAAETQQLAYEQGVDDVALSRQHPEILPAFFKEPTEAIALVRGEALISHAELASRVARLAVLLRREGAGPELAVGVLMPRSPEWVVAVLAVLATGGAFVPLDPEAPEERLRWQVGDATVRIVVARAADRSLAAALGTKKVVAVDFEDLELEVEAPEPEAFGAASRIAGEHLAYVLYTSGSTGRPKGVAVGRGALVRHLEGMERALPLTAQDWVLQQASPIFDPAIEQTLLALRRGAVLVQPDAELATVPELLAELASRRVTVADLPTAYWHEVVRAMTESAGPWPRLSLRLLWVGGEGLPAAAVELWRRSPLAAVGLWNLYGPTEAVITATRFAVSGHVDGDAYVAIGRPLPGREHFVVDRRGALLPFGVPGELWLGGPLARGYVRRPRLTAESFVPHPRRRGERLYRSGDRVRLLASGDVEFLGRLDHQVKVRGFRVELAEIEGELTRHPRVAEAVALSPDGQRLVAYVVPKAESTAEGLWLDELTRHLRSRLPSYLVPQSLIPLAALPRTVGGKIDRRGLEQRFVAIPSEASPLAPRSPGEAMLAEIWREVLGSGPVGVDGDFFALGGHSLLAVRLLARVRAAFGVELPVAVLFENPTVAGLARRIEDARGALPRPPIPSLPKDAPAPLSFAQQGLWILEQLPEARGAYHLPVVLSLDGALDADRLECAFDELVRRHEALRTVIAESDDGPRQRAARFAPRPLPTIDLSALTAADADVLARRLVIAEGRRPFDLVRGPLYRYRLLRLAERRHLLLFNLHHLVADGASLELLLHQLQDAYRGAPLPPTSSPARYAEVAAWQRSVVDGGELAGKIDAWRRRLVSSPPLDLIGDRPRPAARTFRGGLSLRRLDAAAWTALEGLAREHGVTPFAVLLAAFEALLARFSGQERFALGVPVSGRDHPELEALVGMLVDVTPLPVEASPESSFAELLVRAQKTLLAAFDHREVPFAVLAETLAAGQDRDRHPVFQVMLAFQEAASEIALEGLQTRAERWDFGFARLDLTLFAERRDAGLDLVLEHSADLFDPTTARRLLGHLAAVLDAAVSAPSRPVAELAVLGVVERQQLVEWQGPAIADVEDEDLWTLCARCAREQPEALALIHDEAALSYGELERRALALAATLGRLGVGRLGVGRLGVGRESRVGVAMRRTADLAVALWGSLAAGVAYVPLDPAYPAERLRFMVEDSSTEVVLVDEGPLFAGASRQPRWLPLAAVAQDAAGWGSVSPEPRALAYVIYTSGSTGRPKGVAIEHRSALALLRFAAEVWPRSAWEGTLAATSICFDLSIFELFGAWTRGGTVLLAADLLALPSLPARGRARLVNTVPSAASAVVEAGWPSSATTVNLAGDVLPRSLVAGIVAAGAEEVYNLYGPTECTTYATWARVDRSPGAPSIGRPIPGTSARVVDRRGRLLPIGAPGELLLGGLGVARGYLGRPAATAERFVPDPWSGPGARLYRTGDLVRWRAAGELDFLGRLDQQVKIRGFRVEPGEIEQVLHRHPAVREVAVVALDGTAGSSLAAALVAAQGPGSDEDLRRHLAAELPRHMVPEKLLWLAELPLLPNGKVDRRALVRLAATSAAGSETTASRPPRTPAEALLVDLWRELLGRDGIGVDDDFFLLGGHSLLATRLLVRLRRIWGEKVSLRDLFARPTPAALAAWLQGVAAEDAGTADEDELGARPLGARQPGAPKVLSFAQEQLLYLERVEPGRAAYNMPAALVLEGQLSRDALRAAIAELLTRHDVLRSRFPSTEQGPCLDAVPRPLLPIVDLSALGSRADALAEGLSEAEAARPFALVAGPSVRFQLLALGPTRHVLLVTLHHVVADGWSLEILLRELGTLYELGGTVADSDAALGALPLTYADYADWQRRWISGRRRQALAAWWRDRLAGLAPLELPGDRPRSAQRGAGGEVRFTLPPELGEGLTRLARAHAATPFMVLLAVTSALLGRLTGAVDLAVGTPVANRPRRRLEGIVGLFVNTLVLRSRPEPGASFAAFLAASRSAVLDDFAHQDLPFEVLVEELEPPRQAGRTPFFDVLLTVQNTSPSPPRLGELEVDLRVPASRSAKLDLGWSWTLAGDGWQGSLEYAADLFDATTARRFNEHLRRLLQAVLTDPERRLAALPLLSRAEEHHLLSELGPGPELVAGELLPRRLEAVLTAMPDAAALVYADGTSPGTLSRGELARRARALAALLRRHGVGPEVAVGVLLERGPGLLTALLAVLEAGGFYVPLDPAYPAERLAFMAADAELAVLLSEPAGDALLADLAVPRIVLGDAVPSCSPSPAMERGLGGEEPTPIHGEHLAYLIYTSGSTGRPKGAAISHRSLAALGAWAGDVFSAAELAGVFAGTSVCFDLSVFELLVSLANGGTVILGRDPLDLAEHPARARVTLINTVPSVAAELVRSGTIGDGIRVVNLAGEALPKPLVEELSASGVGRVLNLYGPSEDTTYSTWAEVQDDPGTVPPIGRAVSGSEALVLDRDLNALPLGATGELFLGGAGLARGYFARPGTTAERFLPHPWTAGERLYRTGDRVRRRGDGALEFLGRVDQQVKLRGFRIEPGEIEDVLRRHPQVVEAAALVVTAGGEGRLVACVTSPDEPAEEALARHLGARLPGFMVPSRFVVLAALPHTPSGKLDRRAVERLATEALEAEGPSDLRPRSELEAWLAGVWCEVLGLTEVGVRDNFFRLGGHSLSAAAVANRLQAALGEPVAASAVLVAPTVEELARYLAAAHPRAVAARSGRASGEDAAASIAGLAAALEHIPLSPAQERMWFLDQLDPGSSAYALPVAWSLDGALDLPALRRGLDRLLERHAGLRTRFVIDGDEPVQVIAPHVRARWTVVDVSDLEAADRELETETALGALAHRPFDLAADALLRPALIRLDAARHVLLLTLHHIVGDGWSLGVLGRELARFYNAFVSGGEARLEPLPVTFADHAVWQRRRLESGALDAEIAAWKERLAGLPPLELPTDRPREAGAGNRAGQLDVTLPQDLGAALGELGERHDATLFMVLASAFGALLGRLSGQLAFACGTPVSGRQAVAVEGLVGCFVNLLTLRFSLAGQPSFSRLLSDVRQWMIEALASGETPFEHLVRELRPERELGREPLVQVLLVFQNLPFPGLELSGIEAAPRAVKPESARFELTLILAQDQGRLAGWLEYRRDLFDRATVERWLGHFKALLAAVVARPEARLAEHALLSAAQAAQILREVNDRTGVEAAIDVVTRFAAWAERAPEAVAVELADGAWSYGALARQVEDLAAWLAARGLGAESRVAVCMSRSPEWIAALLATLRAGASFLPLDADFLPAERLTEMLREASVELILTAGEPARRLAALAPEVERRQPSAMGWTVPARPLPAFRELDAALAAYTIYTSGSTGRPKGVVLARGGLARLVRSQIPLFALAPGRRALQVASPGFDASISEIFTTLGSGATLVLGGPEALAPGAPLAGTLATRRIEIVTLSPSVLRLLAPGELPGLRTVVSAGETCPPELAARWAPGRRFVNAYGPTEVTVCATATVVETDGVTVGGVEAVDAGPVSVGRPLPEMVCYAVDRRLGLTLPGVPGELVVGGASLARGYLRAPALTAERFVPDPFAGPDRRAGRRLYRTGDLVRRRGDGAFEALGRIDQQVKIRGVRVEPGEIETLLCRHPAVAEAVVLPLVDGGRAERLGACVVPKSGAASPEAPELREMLRRALPEVMVPAVFAVLDEIPRTPSGKRDREALLAVLAPRRDLSCAYVAPRDPLEAELAELWAEVIGVDEVGVEDRFFDLGGHSLLATQVMSRVRERFGVEPPLRAFFESPTVAGQAAVIADLRSAPRPADTAAEDEATIERAERGDDDLAALLADLEQLSDDEAFAELELGSREGKD